MGYVSCQCGIKFVVNWLQLGKEMLTLRIEHLCDFLVVTSQWLRIDCVGRWLDSELQLLTDDYTNVTARLTLQLSQWRQAADNERIDE